MNILALDLGTRCGFASSFYSGVWNLKPSSCESFGELFRKFRHRLFVEITLGGINFIVYEEVKFHRGVDAAHVYGGLEAVLQTVCLDHGIEYKGVGVSVIQKHATGRGMAPKGQKKKIMYDLAVQKFKNINVIDDNHADALWLLDLAINSPQLGLAVG